MSAAARERRNQMLALARRWKDEAVALANPHGEHDATHPDCAVKAYMRCAKELRAALEDRGDGAPDWEAAATAAAVEVAEGLRDAVETNARLAKAAGIEVVR